MVPIGRGQRELIVTVRLERPPPLSTPSLSNWKGGTMVRMRSRSCTGSTLPSVRSVQPSHSLYRPWRRTSLRDHKYILPAYLPLSPRRVYPENINDMEALQVTGPTFHKSRSRGLVVVGFPRHGHDAALHVWVGRVVVVQQVHRSRQE